MQAAQFRGLLVPLLRKTMETAYAPRLRGDELGAENESGTHGAVTPTQHLARVR